MNYFVIGANGEKFGPATVDELNVWAREGRVNGSTMVIAEGLTDSMSISNVPGFHMEVASMPPMSSVQYPRNYMGSVHVPNNLVKAILSTLFCCLPVGIVAIVYAAQVDSLARSGDVAGAQSSANKASIWANWSIGLSLTGTVLYVILIVILGASGNLK